jgi:predicted DNA-binding protein
MRERGKHMTHAIELSDEAYEALEAAATPQGLTSQAYLRLLIDQLFPPDDAVSDSH